MRIVHTEASCGWGGQEIRILEEARGMIGRGHEATVLCPQEARIFAEAPNYGVPAISLPIGRKNLAGLFALRRWLEAASAKVDIVNTHSSTDSWLAALASVLLADPPPIVRTRHVSTAVNTSRITRWLYQSACRHVVVTGEALRTQLVRDNGFDPNSITSVPTGIDLARFQPRDKAAARKQLGLDLERTLVGIVATLRDWKGHTVLFDALDSLKGRYPDLHLLVIGDGPYRDRLDARVAKLGLTHRVKFVGHQNNPEVWLNAMDIFALPSWGDEGISQALMQAMASALPIVTTPVGSLTEVIYDKENGLVAPPRDAQALAAAIAHLIDAPAEARRLGDAARVVAQEKCGREAMLDRMESIFTRFARLEKR